MPTNPWLVLAGALSAAASLAHLAVIVGGAPWYRFFGPGERMARMTEARSLRPTVITFAISGLLAAWAAIAFAGAGLIGRLPLIRRPWSRSARSIWREAWRPCLFYWRREAGSAGSGSGVR